jgi:hypothetical protein
MRVGRTAQRVVVKEAAIRLPILLRAHIVIEGMKRSLYFIATVSLTAGLSIGCSAQERAPADTSKMTREEWQSRVNASRERLEQRREEQRLEREKQPGSKQEELQRERESRFGAKQEELRLDREKRIEPKRDELRRQREKQKDLRGLN